MFADVLEAIAVALEELFGNFILHDKTPFLVLLEVYCQ